MNVQSTIRPGLRHVALLLFGAAVVVCCGCTSSLLQLPSNGVTSRLTEFVKGESKDKVQTDFTDDFDTSLQTPVLGDYISVQGNTVVPLRGVGLVVNLDGTGGSPPPSTLQKSLRQEMARLNIPNPSRILASPSTALVVVTAYLPANVRKGQPFDVRILLPPNTNATSLKGGLLLKTRLFEESEIRGHGVKKGKEYASAEGPVMTAFGADNGGAQTQGLLARGSIPGGAISTTDRNLEIVLRKKFQSIRKSKQIADAVSSRFQLYDRFGRLEPQAEAKTNAVVQLKSHPTYRNNFPRFHHVIRNIPLAENEVARRLRMESLAEDLLDPAKAALAAVQLEAIGNDARPFLRSGLQSPHADVRFLAAEALVYLQDPVGVEELKVAARDEPAFRVYALAALSILDNAQSVLALRELLNSESLETRYGAVRALSDLDNNDRSLNTQRYKKRFVLRQIESSGKPAIHLARRRSPEVTIFDVSQELLLPAVLNMGHRIRLIGHDGDDTVQISHYRVGEEPVRRQCSRRLTDIVHTAGEMGAAYPDIVQFMIEADKQDNLPGELGIDRLPQSGRSYLPKTGTAESGSMRKLGSAAKLPGIFDRIEDENTGEEVEPLDVTTFKQPKEDTITDTAPTSLEDAVPDSESESVESTDHNSSSGLMKQILKNPFGQHSF